MRVVEVTGFGGPEVLVPAERDDPVAGAGELVVDVEAAGVLFLDTQLRSGWGQEYFGVQPPFVPGGAVAGTVASTGAGVDPGWVGLRVLAGMNKPGEYRGGGYAERALAPADEVFAVPDEVGLPDALTARDGRVALSRFGRATIQPGERVLVNAAAGSLGAWLVPLAKRSGAFVVAAARGERKLQQARELGADVAVDYSEEGWAPQARQVAGGAMDVVFDGTGGAVGRAAYDITASGGRFLSYGAASGDFAMVDPADAERRGITVVGIDDGIRPDEWRPLIERALSELASGRMRPVVGQTFALERAADAHVAIEARKTVGKTVLLP